MLNTGENAVIGLSLAFGTFFLLVYIDWRATQKKIKKAKEYENEFKKGYEVEDKRWPNMIGLSAQIERDMYTDAQVDIPALKEKKKTKKKKRKKTKK